MTYTANENSVADGEPFECYEFTTPTTVYRYTTFPEAVTLNGEVFSPETMDRTVFDVSMVNDGLKTMDIMLPQDNDLVQIYKAEALPDFLSVVVYRAHVGDDLSSEFSVEWRGECVGIAMQSEWFVIKTRSILGALLTGQNRMAKYQRNCNNRVYDQRCKLVEANFTTTTTVLRNLGSIVRVANDGVDNGALQLGRIVNTRTGETRNIVNNADRALGGANISISYPFNDLVDGDTVNLILGCTNQRSICVSRFDNIENFNGFPFIPVKNPFQE